MGSAHISSMGADDVMHSNNYAAARLQGLEKDLNLHGDQYQTALSIFFVAYVWIYSCSSNSPTTATDPVTRSACKSPQTRCSTTPAVPRFI